MKLNEIYTRAVNLCGSNDTGEYMDFALAAVNQLYGEAFYENNSLRRSKGKAKLENIPTAVSLDEEFAFEEELAAAFAYGWASRLLIADSDIDEGRHIIYQNFFTTMVNTWRKATEEAVEDSYAVD